MAEALIKYETIDDQQIKDIMAGQTPRPPQDWDDIEPRSGRGVSVPTRARTRPPTVAPSAVPPASTELSS